MLNEFGSYADAIDSTKAEVGRKSVVASSSERSSCCVTGVSAPPSNVSEVAPRPVSSATAWNCNPYLGNFYNYYGNNGYEMGAPANTGVADVHQYENQKCAAVNQYPRNYTQHTIQSASVLQCCDPRCQLISDHAKYPFSNNLAHKYNTQRPSKPPPRKAYGLENKGEVNGHAVTGFPYGGQHDLNKYNGQQQPAPTQQQQYNIYPNTIKSSKHVLIPETTSLGDYFTDIGKPAYWSKPNVWNRGVSGSYYGTEMQKMATAASAHQRTNGTANERGILFNRLLERRNRAMYDMSYMPNYHYGRPPLPPPPPPPKNVAYCQSYPTERDLYGDCGNTRLPLQNDSYQTLPMYNVHCVEPPAPHRDTKDASPHDNRPDTKSRILDKNPNLDVREFLSTWDDVEDDKAPEPETPLIVLDCTSLEGDALAKVKEKLGDSVTNLANPQNDFTSKNPAAVLKVVDDHNVVSPHTSVIQESVPDSLTSRKDKREKSPTDSSHQPDTYNGAMWYGSQPQPQPQQPKKKDELSYDLVEMTERLVNTVDKLFGDEKCEPKGPFYDNRREPETVKDDQWNINLNYKRNKGDKITVPHSVVPDLRYRVAKEDFVPYKAPSLVPEYDKEPEKNVSCSFNLQKSNNDLKFSVNYSKQTEHYASRVQDYSVKYKNYETVTESLKSKPRVEDYSYKNYYNSYYYNNPSCEYMQMENVKECTYDVENMDNHNSDITLVKADLEKSLKEITHQFSYQKKLDADKLPDKSPVAHIAEKATPENTISPTSVIQKTGSCGEEKVLDERDESFNDNSMLSMPSLSPPSCPPPAPAKQVGLTLNDVYDDEVIFDTLNGKPEEELNFTNVLKKADAERDSVVYPLNLALAKETAKENPASVAKSGGVVGDDNETESDPVFKVDDGYYSVETHSEKEVSANDSDEAKKTTTPDTPAAAYKTCIVSRDRYEHPELARTVGEGPVLQVADQAVLNLAKESVMDVPAVMVDESSNHPVSDTESLGKPDDVFGKLHNSSTDEEKLLKSSKFKKYKKHKKMKYKKDQEQASVADSVIKPNGNVIRFKHIFPNTRPCSEEAFIDNERKSENGPALAFLSTCQVTVTDNPTAPASLPILVSEEADNRDQYNAKKRKFAGVVKDADLPVKKRKQDRMAGIESCPSNTDRIVETVVPEASRVNEEDALEKCSLNGKYPVQTDHENDAHLSLEQQSEGCKKSKKKHKKDKNRLKMKFKKQKKKDKCAQIRDGDSSGDRAESPERAMSNDETAEPCKSNTSGTETSEVSGENYISPRHAIRPSTQYTIEPVDYVGDEVTLNDCIDEAPLSPPSSVNSDRTECRENGNCDEQSGLSDQNYLSGSHKKFKSYHVTDDEDADAFSTVDSADNVIDTESAVSVSKTPPSGSQNEQHSPKGGDSGFNEPDVQHEEPISPLSNCFSPQLPVFRSKISPLKDSPPYEPSLGAKSDTEYPLALCVTSTTQPGLPERQDVRVYKSPIPDTEIDAIVEHSSEPASPIQHLHQSNQSPFVEDKDRIVSPIPEITESSRPSTPICPPPEEAESSEIATEFCKIEENAGQVERQTPPLNLSWSKEPSPIADRNDCDWSKVRERSSVYEEPSPIGHDKDTQWIGRAEKSIWSHENSPSPSVTDDTPANDITWSPVPVADLTGLPEEHRSMDWDGNNSPFRLDENVDHEEAITEAPAPAKSIWSDNSPLASDDEDMERSPRTRFADYDHENGMDECRWSRRNSRSDDEPESPKRWSSSDSDDSDSSSVSSGTSKSSSSRSSCSKRHSMESLVDESSAKKSDSSSESSDEQSGSGDEGANCKIDYLFNIPSVAPTPHCDLNKDEGADEEAEREDRSKAPSPNFDLHDEAFAGDLKLIKAPSPFCILRDNEAISGVERLGVDKEGRSNRQYFSDESSISSVAPSPNCDIIDGVLLDDTDTGRSDDFFASTGPENTVVYEQVPSLRTLAAKMLAEMSFNAVPSFNRLEVWVTPERTEIIIHSDDVEEQSDLVLANDNHLMITDAYEDEEVNITPNFDKIKEISFDYAMELDSQADKSEEELQCQCLIISSEESIVCLRCSLNSSIIVNQDLDIDRYRNEADAINCDNGIPSITIDPWSTPNESNCIEDSFIDHRINVTPEHYYTTPCEPVPPSISVDEDKEADNEVQTITDSQRSLSRWCRNDVQIKVQLPWHKIFNLDTIGQTNQKTLELGPAQIEVRLSPDDASLWKLVNSKNERVSPVVKVKRLILQRALDSPVPSEKRASSVESLASENAQTKEVVSRLPKMVIKKTSCKEYKSFLQLNAMQPVVKLYKSKSLDALALKMGQRNNLTIDLKRLKLNGSLESIPEAISDEVERALVEQFDENIPREEDENGSRKSRSVKGDSESSVDLVTVLDTSTPPRDVSMKPERHHCLLCHRSFTSEQAYHVHVKGRFHRHLELTQRKTIHAMYRHFTGHVCPRLRPLSAKERKRMKWKPRGANVDHFYYQKTPLQIALHKSIFEDTRNADQERS